MGIPTRIESQKVFLSEISSYLQLKHLHNKTHKKRQAHQFKEGTTPFKFYILGFISFIFILSIFVWLWEFSKITSLIIKMIITNFNIQNKFWIKQFINIILSVYTLNQLLDKHILKYSLNIPIHEEEDNNKFDLIKKLYIFLYI